MTDEFCTIKDVWATVLNQTESNSYEHKNELIIALR